MLVGKIRSGAVVLVIAFGLYSFLLSVALWVQYIRHCSRARPCFAVSKSPVVSRRRRWRTLLLEVLRVTFAFPHGSHWLHYSLSDIMWQQATCMSQYNANWSKWLVCNHAKLLLQVDISFLTTPTGNLGWNNVTIQLQFIFNSRFLSDPSGSPPTLWPGLPIYGRW